MKSEYPNARICNSRHGARDAGQALNDMIVRRPAVERSTGLSRASLYEMMGRGDFPSAIRIGKRAVGWSAAEIAEWLESRARTIKLHQAKMKETKSL